MPKAKAAKQKPTNKKGSVHVPAHTIKRKGKTIHVRAYNRVKKHGK